MSNIIDNPYVEADMTKNFLCRLYNEDNNSIEVKTNGMNPFDIWHVLNYNAYDQLVVPVILNQIISNNVDKGFITFNSETRRVYLTEAGRRWSELNCGASASRLSL